MTRKLSARVWASFILIGLVGQVAWTVENMYFNVFLYNTISTDPSYIAAMVAASAVAATATTLFMGALSDKLARRKVFIVAGYVLWGLSTLSFGFITVDTVGAWFPAAGAASAAAGLVVVMDCVMTFFGSTANDAAFNAYITDATDTSNRGKAESVLATFPLISMLIVFGLLDGLTQQGRWRTFFTIVGLAVSAAGLIAALLVKDEPLEKKDEPYFRNIVYGFRPSVIKSHGRLYIAFAAYLAFASAVQVFFPYLIIYMQMYLGFENYAVILGVVLIAASAVSVAGGGLIDRAGKLNVVLPAAGVMLAGLIAMYFVRSFVPVILAGIVMMGGYMLVTAVLSAIIRDCTPPDKAGLFQGIRMIFAVLLPMVIGPWIGAAVIKNSGATYEDLGVVKSVPTPAVFLAAAAVLALVVIPVAALRKMERRES